MVDEVGCGGAAGVEAVLNGAVCDGDGEVGFSAAGWSRQDQVAAFSDELGAEVGAEPCPTDAGLEGEVELLDGLEEGEVGLASEALDAGASAVCDLGGEEVHEELAVVRGTRVLFSGSAVLELGQDAQDGGEAKAFEQGDEVDMVVHAACPLAVLCCESEHFAPCFKARRTSNTVKRS